MDQLKKLLVKPRIWHSHLHRLRFRSLLLKPERCSFKEHITSPFG